MTDAPACPSLEFALELKVAIGPILDSGSSPAGVRRTVPITGGTFSGPRLRGRILPGGADWQLVENDGLTFVDARYVLETGDGVRIEVRNKGIRHGSSDLMARINAGEVIAPSEYYFRTTPRFFPPPGQHDWLTRSIFVGSGARYADLVIVKVWSLS